jgi:formate hydrogenlyase subunit 4
VIWSCHLLLSLFSPVVYALQSREWTADLLLVIYLLGLSKFASGLAAFELAAPFGPMSSGRQLVIHILAEPVLIVTTYALVLIRGSSTLVMWTSEPSQRVPSVLETVTDPAMVLILLSLLVVLLAEGGRMPFDNPLGRLELAMIEAGPYLEFSGRGLGLIEWAGAMRLTFFLSLLATLIVPPSVTSPTLREVATLTLSHLSLIVVLAFLLGIWELFQVKLRLRAIWEWLVAGLAFALIAVIYLIINRLSN